MTEHLHRRSLVAALGTGVASLAGCLGDGSPVAGSADDGEGSRTVQVTSVDDVPANAPLRPSVEAVRSSSNGDSSARIRVEVTNDADRSVWNRSVRIPAFDSFVSEAGPSGNQLLLLPPDGEYDTVGDGCWRADIDTHEVNHAYTDVVTDVAYDGGQTRTNAFDVYGHPDNSGPCLRPGDYRVVSSYRPADSPGGDAGSRFRWGFDLTVGDS